MIAAKRLELANGGKIPTSAQIEAEMKKLNQEKAANFKFGTPEEVQKARELVSLLVDFTPVGAAKGILEALRGKDTFTGEEIAGLQRILAILPYDKVADALKYGGKYLDNLASALTNDKKLATEIGEVATKNLGKADEVADTGKAVVNKVDGTGVKLTHDSDSIWKMKATDRGNEIENILANTEYKDYYNIGQQNNGKFPVIDFQKGNEVISLKTIDLNAKSYQGNRGTNQIMKYLDALDREIKVSGKTATKTLDIRIPKGTTNKVDLKKLRDEAVDMGIKLIVKEF